MISSGQFILLLDSNSGEITGNEEEREAGTLQFGLSLYPSAILKLIKLLIDHNQAQQRSVIVPVTHSRLYLRKPLHTLNTELL